MSTNISRINLTIVFFSSIFGVMPEINKHYVEHKNISTNTELFDFKQYYPKKYLRKSLIEYLFSSLTNKKIYLSKLASSFVESDLISCIDQLLIKSCNVDTKIVFIADGFGANIALRYTEIRKDPRIKLICAWYPHLIFPKTEDFPKKTTGIQEPDLKNIPSNTKIIIFHGDKDNAVEPENLNKAIHYSKNLPNVETVVYPKAEHAFSEKYLHNGFQIFPIFGFTKQIVRHIIILGNEWRKKLAYWPTHTDVHT